MSELIYENKKYLGRMLKKEASDGSWKIYNAEFETDGKYNFKCGVFDNCKGFDLLQEGSTVNIGYEEGSYEHSIHGTVKTRTIKFIGEVKEQTLTDKAFKAHKQATTEQSSTGFTDEEDDFFTSYKENMIEAGYKMTDLNLNHFIGTWVINKEQGISKEQVERLSMLFGQICVPPQ